MQDFSFFAPKLFASPILGPAKHTPPTPLNYVKNEKFGVFRQTEDPGLWIELDRPDSKMDPLRIMGRGHTG